MSCLKLMTPPVLPTRFPSAPPAAGDDVDRISRHVAQFGSKQGASFILRPAGWIPKGDTYMKSVIRVVFVQT